ncbi:MAG: DUF4296 domain-containing protein [Crocinitomicaceae bacterium]|nr:DUF4296 domain-containing protein [Crocinitomicaceae bacterium]
MRFLTVIFLLSCLFSCSDGIKRKDAPVDLIERNQMVNVMKDLIKLESYIQGKYPSVAQYQKVMVNSGDSLLGTFGLTKDRFQSSLEYYGARQDMMKEIYDDILDDLNRELGDLNAQVKDSI